MKTPINKAIEQFEELKSKAPNLRDMLYLDGVLAVLDSLKPYEEEFVKTISNTTLNIETNNGNIQM